MSTLKVAGVRGLSASADAITVHASDGTATGKFTNLPGRNLIINGDFSCAQRTTAAVTTSDGSNEGHQTVDRWRADLSSAAVFTQQQVDLTAATDPDGFYKAWKIDCTTVDSSVAASDWAVFQQYVEGLNWAQLNYGRSDAKTITVSFWIKSTKTGTYSFAIRNSAADRHYVAEYTVSTTNTWEKKSFTIPGDTSGTWLTTNGIGARLTWALLMGTQDSTSAGSWGAGNKFGSTNQVNFFDNTSNDLYITGVQVEIGSIATDFCHENHAETLRKCQRYYEALYMNAGTAMWISWASGSNAKMEYSFKVTKRAVPTGVLGTGATWSGATPLEFHSTNIAGFHHSSTQYSLGGANGILAFSFNAEL